MTKRLVVAEKPSVAMSIAAVLGVKGKQDGYYENEEYIVSWCYGHLTELAEPDAYDERFRKWRRDDLPIIPASFKYKISRDKYRQFAILKALMHREDVSAVINACDAGREGELIFRNLYTQAKCEKPILRLWISSMEDHAILDGFANLKDGSAYDNLHAAAQCREWADWLVGINATRLFSTIYHRTLNVGRVVSPTLAILVKREAEIEAFEPEPFYTVELGFDGFTASSMRYPTKDEADAVAEMCGPNTATVDKVQRKEFTQNPPALFDLTTLQRDANRLFGFSAQQTLDYVQSLYEKKLCTYPRTDSRYLPDDMEDSLKALVLCAAGIVGSDLPFAIHAEQVCSSKKVSDHHAILPTIVAGEYDKSLLPSGEKQILLLIARQVLIAVSAPFRYEETRARLICSNTEFLASGKTVTEPGWRIYTKPTKELKSLPALEEGQVLAAKEISVKDGMTTPPKRYTEGTLLSAMEHAGNEDTPEDSERKGLGTPATRANIIEKLISAGFAERKKGEKHTTLSPASIGVSLVTVLPEELQSPLLTAEWEQKLKLVERGELSAEDFMAEISLMVNDLVASYQPVRDADVLFPSDREVIGKCPRCGGNVTESKKGYFCERHDCRFGLWKDNNYLLDKKIYLTKQIASVLLKERRISVKGIFSAKTGRPYDATLVLMDNGKKASYTLEFETK